MSHPHPVNPPVEAAPLRVGLLGFGTVGSGTCKVLARNAHLIRARAGRPIELRMIATRTPERVSQGAASGIALMPSAHDLVSHPDLDVVVEAIGGCGAARDLVLQAIAQGKHVVTANKALLAEHGEEVFAAAARHNVTVAFEGAVAVSIPIVKALREGLTANDVQWLAGIVNGTSNFILTQMREHGTTFEAALAEAQRLGYAEADPSFDVDGIDAAHKLALLASLAFGMPLRYHQIQPKGIASLETADFEGAAALGYTIKLLATAKKSEQGVALAVQPTLIPKDSLMGKVDGSMNGVMVKSDAAGLTMYYGAGAGSEQTASAVVADLVDIARDKGNAQTGRVPHLGFHETPLAAPRIAAPENRCGHFGVRLPLAPGLPSAGTDVRPVLDAFSRHGVGVARSHRWTGAAPQGSGQLFLQTEPTTLGTLLAAVKAAEALPQVGGRASVLPVEDLS
ncbi:homoserine dehydrogenase [Hydrogenophaga aquatica]